MIPLDWRQIAGVHQSDAGEVSAVWLALDRDADTVHLYDSCLFRGEDRNPIIVSEGLNARGRWIPIAHNSAELAESLMHRGCNMEPKACKETPAMIEVISGDISARMRTGRFMVEKRLADWTDEYKSFYREDAKVPQGSHPLMMATRHAMAQLEYAKARETRSYTQSRNYQKVAIV